MFKREEVLAVIVTCGLKGIHIDSNNPGWLSNNATQNLLLTEGLAEIRVLIFYRL